MISRQDRLQLIESESERLIKYLGPYPLTLRPFLAPVAFGKYAMLQPTW